jgi:hypothetical protein
MHGRAGLSLRHSPRPRIRKMEYRYVSMLMHCPFCHVTHAFLRHGTLDNDQIADLLAT